MSDNYKHSKAFEEEAWQDMSSILDREMPEKKKRRFFFWLFPLLILGIASLIFILPEKNGKERVVQNNVEAISPASVENRIEKTPLIDSGENTTGISNSEIKSMNKEIDSKNIISNSSSSKVKSFKEKSTIGDKIYFLNEKNVKSTPSKYNDGIDINKGDENEIINDVKITNLFSVKEDKVVKDGIEIKEKTKTISYPEKIENQIPQLEEEKPITQIPFITKKNRWGLVIESQMVFQDKNEWGTRLGIKYKKIFNPRFSLQTGLEYKLMVNNDKNNRYGSIALDNNGIISVPPLQDELYNTENKLSIRHQLILPVTMSYSISKRWRMEAGLAAIYNFKPDRVISIQESEFVQLGSANSIIAVIYPDWDFSARIGTEVKLTNRLGILMSYEQGLKKRLTENRTSNPIGEAQAIDGYSGRMRHWSLGLRFKLK